MAYIALDVTAVINDDVQLVRSAYAAMDVTVAHAIVPLAIASVVIVPLAIASVVIGTLDALGTPWGLLQHYWVLLRFVLTLVARVVLLVDRQTIGSLAEAAGSGADAHVLP